MKKILILGCTGSIGKSAIQCISEFSNHFQIVGLSAHSNIRGMLEIACKFGVKNLCLTDNVTQKCPEVALYGDEGLRKLIRESEADIVLNGIAGAAGLLPSIEAVKLGKTLALANKETIVMAGSLILAEAKNTGAKIIPVDSEHSAIFNMIERFGHNTIDSVILTASGGAFKNTPREELPFKKAVDALKHPTWNMGQKITIDSASLANKGLEVIEAAYLFNLRSEQIKVVIHPQSLVHSLIRTKDNALYAQISNPNMVHPIHCAFSWPECLPCSLEPLDLTCGVEMSFLPPRFEDFPMLSLSYKALELGGAYTIAYNASNEVAVDAFVRDTIAFTDIPLICDQVLMYDWSAVPTDYEDVFKFDVMARSRAIDVIKKVKK